MAGIAHRENQYFLAKTDPETYSIEQFEREHETVWDGVRGSGGLVEGVFVTRGESFVPTGEFGFGIGSVGAGASVLSGGVA